MNYPLTKLQILESVKQYLEDDLTNRNLEADAEKYAKELAKLLSSKDGYSLNGNFRSKLTQFIAVDGAKKQGETAVNLQGVYLIGAVPNKKETNDSKAVKIRLKRFQGCYNYAKSIIYGVNDALKARGFVFNKDKRYDTTSEAILAMHADSLQSKGPYDNRTSRTAFDVEEKALTAAYTEYRMTLNDLEFLTHQFDAEYKPHYIKHITKSKTFDAHGFGRIMATKGLQNTYRGWPYLSAGSSYISLGSHAAVKWIFGHIKGFLDYYPSNYSAFIAKRQIKLPEVKYKGEVCLTPQALAIRKHLLQKYQSKLDRQKDIEFEHRDLTKPWIDSIDEVRGVINLITPFNVDEHISYVNDILFNQLSLKVSDIWTLKCNVQNNLDRDQGSAFKTDVDYDAQRLIFTGEQKDAKLRMVEPMAAYPQSWLTIATEEIVNCATALPWRLGMLDFNTTKRQYTEWFTRMLERGHFSIPFDYSSYDYGIVDQQMTAWGYWMSTMYDDPVMKDCLQMTGVLCFQTLFMMGKPVRNAGDIWNKYRTFDYFKMVKGRAEHNILRSKRYAKGSMLEKQLEKELEQIYADDYYAVLVYMYRAWWKSGVVITNTAESDVNSVASSHAVPHWIFEKLRFPEVARYDFISRNKSESNTSGDDILVTYPRFICLSPDGQRKYMHEVYNYDDWVPITYQEFLQAAESVYYDKLHWQLNAAKQVDVFYKDTFYGEDIYVPVSEFLQIMHTPHSDMSQYLIRRKTLRNFPSMPYTERISKLTFVASDLPIDGRLQSSLEGDIESYELFADVLLYSSKHLNKFARDQKYEPYEGKDARKRRESGNPTLYSVASLPQNTKLLGLEWFFGHFKKYGQDTMKQISTYAINKLDGNIDALYTVLSELEIRAEHRRGLLNSLVDSLEPLVATEMFGNEYLDSVRALNTSSINHVEQLVKVIEQKGITIEPVSLPDEEKNISGLTLSDDVGLSRLDQQVESEMIT